MLSRRSDVRRTSPRSLTAACAASAALALALGGCATSDDWSVARDDGEPVGALAPGFVDASATPSPEATIAPEDGSWDAVHPPAGYRVVLLTATFDSTTAALTAGVTAWAEAEDVSLKTVTIDEPAEAVDGVVRAMELGPDLIVATGPALVDPLALVTASHLDRQFLVIGAQLPEPTANVTAAIWPGAASRGSEVPDADGSADPRAYTSGRADAAARAGVASVLHDLTGIVIQLD